MPFDPPAPAARLSVMYVLSAFPVLSETFVSNEIRAMRALGHRVVPLALRPHDGPCQPEDAAFRAETLALAAEPRIAALLRALGNPARLARALRFVAAQRGLPRRSLLLAGARVALAARREGCTHLHAHFMHAAAATAITAARLSGCTVSFTGHGYDIYGAPADLPAKLRATDLAIAVCDDMRADLRAMAPGARVALVRCGIDPARFRPAPGPSNGRLLAIGRLAPQKGYEVLLAALARLPPAQRPVIDVVGEGTLRAEIEAAIAALGLAPWLRLLDARDSAWIAAEGPRYQGFVAPYVITPEGDRDTGPIVAKEAMAMGLPIVASALMGLKETVAPGSGRQVPPGDVAALGEALAWLAGLTPAERRALGAAGRAHVEAGFTLQAQAASLTAAIAALRP